MWFAKTKGGAGRKASWSAARLSRAVINVFDFIGHPCVKRRSFPVRHCVHAALRLRSHMLHLSVVQAGDVQRRARDDTHPSAVTPDAFRSRMSATI